MFTNEEITNARWIYIQSESDTNKVNNHETVEFKRTGKDAWLIIMDEKEEMVSNDYQVMIMVNYLMYNNYYNTGYATIK